jgi:hypothetical protein
LSHREERIEGTPTGLAVIHYGFRNHRSDGTFSSVDRQGHHSVSRARTIAGLFGFTLIQSFDCPDLYRLAGRKPSPAVPRQPMIVSERPHHPGSRMTAPSMQRKPDAPTNVSLGLGVRERWKDGGASVVLDWAHGLLDPEPRLFGLRCYGVNARRSPRTAQSAGISAAVLSRSLAGLLGWLLNAARILGQHSRPKKREPDSYRAFIIGPDGLAIAVHTVVASYDAEALERATQLQGELPIELWCGSRKVADIPAAPQDAGENVAL